MRTGVLVSTGLHASLILLAAVGIGMTQPLEAIPVESIAVDLVPIEEFSNIRAGSLDSTIVETETPSLVKDEVPAELAQPTGNTEEDQPTPQDAETESPRPTDNTAPAPESVPEPVVEPEPEPVAPEPVTRSVPVPEPVAEPEPEPVAEPTPEPEPEPVAEPEPEPVPEVTPLATPEATAEPKDIAPQPVQRTASLDQKRADFKRQRDAEAKKAAEQKEKEAADKKAAEDKEKKEAADKKAADEKKKKAAEQKRIEEANRRAQEAKELADEVANIINTEESRGATTGQGGEPTLGKETGQAARLSQSQIDGLVAQIRDCILMPPGAEEADARAELMFSIDQNGGLRGTPERMSQSTSPVEEAYARAVQRAVATCGPYTVVAGQDVRAQFRAREF